MELALIVLFSWVACSVPIAIGVGRLLAGRQ